MYHAGSNWLVFEMKKKILLLYFCYFYAVMNFQHFLDAGSEATCIIKYFFERK